MNIKLLCIGKTDDPNLDKLIAVYTKRLKHYVNFELEIIPDLKKTKNLSEDQQKEKAGIEIEEYQLSEGFNKTILAYKIIVSFNQNLETIISI